MGVGVQRHGPAALPSGKTRYPFYRRLGGPQGRSGQVRKVSPTPGFDPRTVQLVASLYTDYAIPDHAIIIIITIIIIIIILVITFMQGIYNYIPETNHVSRVQCCSSSLFTICATLNVISRVKYVSYFHISTLSPVPGC
jgi:hypothetical protein